MNEKDKRAFLEDFKNADMSKKVDMWFYALDQEAMWDEIISEMSAIAQEKISGKAKFVKE